ncbi:hypothetical protein P7H17_16635 [Paenibacillus larvae]|nr:hypothetical protein [Paenibacillus larvae]MDT2287335.1 hypothetical protein [Paenibacillus larvae]
MTGARFDYSRNMRGIKRTEDNSDMVTALIRYWKSRRKRGSDDVYHAKVGRNRRTSGKADWAGLYRRPRRVAKWGRGWPPHNQCV